MTGSDFETDFGEEDLFADDEIGSPSEPSDAPARLYEHLSITADEGQKPLRIDKFLTDRLPHVSRNRIQMSAEAGAIFVGDKPVKSNYKVKPFDCISLRLERPPYEGDPVVPEDIPLDVVYEDEYLLVINKPPGMVVHPGHGNYSGTLLNALAFYLRDEQNFDPSDPRLGLVHRIDKDTSGLLVIAKTPEVKSALGKQFFHKTTKRSYKALVWGIPKEDEGTVRTNLVRDPRNRLIYTTCPYEGEEGKTAVTHWTTKEKLGFVALIECRLETGRTHQIRVHMKSLGHPIFNDSAYGGDQILRGRRDGSYRKFVHNCFEICPRQALHAESLGFFHPVLKRDLFFEAPLPTDMSALVEKWRSLGIEEI